MIGFLVMELILFSSFSGTLSATPEILSPEEKAVVDQSWSLVRTHRLQNVSLRVLDDVGKPYTGTLAVKQDSISFIFLIGDAYRFQDGKWVLSREYFELTPSHSYYVYAPWKEVERVKGAFDFSTANTLYAQFSKEGIIDFHIEVGPYLTGGQIGAWNTLPDWAKTMDFDSLKTNMRGYVEALASNFKGRVQNYHLWTEANAYYGNGDWPIDRVIDIINMEALTIRSIDPKARVYVDLDNITPTSIAFFKGTNSWTTEEFVQQLLAKSVPFDVIGLEPHYGGGEAQRVGGMDNLYYRLNELSKFGKPIYIWEDGPASFIEPKYLNDEWLRNLWHGVPTEEKQAEYMVAETIVALGNPSVIGLRFAWLYDAPNDPLFWHRFNGVLYENGTRKPSFGALEDLWSKVKTDLTIRSENGVAAFKALPGVYSIRAEGYQPFKISVVEETSGPISITLISTAPPATISTTTSEFTVMQGQGPSTLAFYLMVALGALVIFGVAIRVLRKERREPRKPLAST